MAALVAFPVARAHGSGRQRHALERIRELAAEVAALHDERRADVTYLLPYVRRLEVVAHEFGPAAMSSVRAIEARLDRMARRASGEGGDAA